MGQLLPDPAPGASSHQHHGHDRRAKIGGDRIHPEAPPQRRPPRAVDQHVAQPQRQRGTATGPQHIAGRPQLFVQRQHGGQQQPEHSGCHAQPGQRRRTPVAQQAAGQQAEHGAGQGTQGAQQSFRIMAKPGIGVPLVDPRGEQRGIQTAGRIGPRRQIADAQQHTPQMRK
ncbi:hypothetical protein G6F55_013490 [Rhizopus delemar]|nr:hypothetical protein G6F55_013490 [Rhizopus delemar]